MRQSVFFHTTQKQAPKDAQLQSHQLLLRGGFIRQVAAGRYAFLPLGFRVWERIVAVIDEEMRALGSQRIVTPSLHPIEIWQATNRDKAFGGEMLVVEDHHGSAFALGATAEGLMTELIKDSNLTYKELPVIIHQFSPKFRDEKRPRGGLLRVREFMMKDAYSFHASEEDLLEWYQRFYDAYLKLAKKFDLNVIPVQADSGAIGGDYNHEFMVQAEAGEDVILVCTSCDYAANVEKATSRFEEPEQDDEQRQREDIKGEGIIGVEALADYLDIPVTTTTKTIIYQADEKVVAVMIRGDYDINEVKLRHVLGVTELSLADEDTVKRVTGAEVGYAGPIDLSKEVRLLADLSCQNRINFEVGANKTDYHTINANFERDFPTPEFVDVREARPGDICPECDGNLHAQKTIEWGHVFHQGQFYATPHNATFTDQDGEQKTIWQGAYGIGVGRTMATIVETHHDKQGILWPESVAPFTVHLIGLDLQDQVVLQQAETIYQTLQEHSVEVLFDDRVDKRPGEKFAESDLIGIPYRVVVSKRTEGKLEVKRRSGHKAELMDVGSLFNFIQTNK